jgi:hypothetical protein
LKLFLNLKTAKALGITVPLPLFGRADEIVNEAPRVHHAARWRGGRGFADLPVLMNPAGHCLCAIALYFLAQRASSSALSASRS